MWRFIDRYGFDAYKNSHWPTRDHVIPFKLFILATASIRHFRAEDELIAGNAGAYAQAIAFGGAKDLKLKKYQRTLVRTAHPEDISR